MAAWAETEVLPPLVGGKMDRIAIRSQQGRVRTLSKELKEWTDGSTRVYDLAAAGEFLVLLEDLRELSDAIGMLTITDPLTELIKRSAPKDD